MGKFTREMVTDYADKLLIGLTEEETKMVLDEFDVIDKTIDLINRIDGIERLEPMTHALDRCIDDLRNDEVFESPSITDILSNCDDALNDQVRVPKVVE